MTLCNTHFAFIVVCLLVVASSGAQEVSQSDLQRCMELADADQRLACFDALAKAGTGSEPTTKQEPAQPDPVDRAPQKAITAESVVEAGSDAPVPANDGDRAAPEAAASTESAVAAPVAPASSREAAAVGVAADSAVIDANGEKAAPEIPVAKDMPETAAEPAVPATPSSAAVAAADDAGEDLQPAQDAPASADPSMELGSEHLDNAGASDGDAAELAITATVVEVTMQRHKVLHFHLDNGNVWRQIEGRRFNYPRDGSFEVIITRGMMGDYRLRLDEKSPMTRIRRIK